MGQCHSTNVDAGRSNTVLVVVQQTFCQLTHLPNPYFMFSYLVKLKLALPRTVCVQGVSVQNMGVQTVGV